MKATIASKLAKGADGRDEKECFKEAIRRIKAAAQKGWESANFSYLYPSSIKDLRKLGYLVEFREGYHYSIGDYYTGYQESTWYVVWGDEIKCYVKDKKTFEKKVKTYETSPWYKKLFLEDPSTKWRG